MTSMREKYAVEIAAMRERKRARWGAESLAAAAAPARADPPLAPQRLALPGSSKSAPQLPSVAGPDSGVLTISATLPVYPVAVRAATSTAIVASAAPRAIAAAAAVNDLGELVDPDELLGSQIEYAFESAATDSQYNLAKRFLGKPGGAIVQSRGLSHMFDGGAADAAALAVAAVANAAAAAKPAAIVKERAEREKQRLGWIESYRKPPWRGELPPSIKEMVSPAGAPPLAAPQPAAVDDAVIATRAARKAVQRREYKVRQRAADPKAWKKKRAEQERKRCVNKANQAMVPAVLPAVLPATPPVVVAPVLFFAEPLTMTDLPSIGRHAPDGTCPAPGTAVLGVLLGRDESMAPQFEGDNPRVTTAGETLGAVKEAVYEATVLSAEESRRHRRVARNEAYEERCRTGIDEKPTQDAFDDYPAFRKAYQAWNKRQERARKGGRLLSG